MSEEITGHKVKWTKVDKEATTKLEIKFLTRTGIDTDLGNLNHRDKWSASKMLFDDNSVIVDHRVNVENRTRILVVLPQNAYSTIYRSTNELPEI